jgi:hypothetical protein
MRAPSTVHSKDGSTFDDGCALQVYRYGLCVPCDVLKLGSEKCMGVDFCVDLENARYKKPGGRNKECECRR